MTGLRTSTIADGLHPVSHGSRGARNCANSRSVNPMDTSTRVQLLQSLSDCQTRNSSPSRRMSLSFVTGRHCILLDPHLSARVPSAVLPANFQHRTGRQSAYDALIVDFTEFAEVVVTHNYNRTPLPHLQNVEDCLQHWRRRWPYAEVVEKQARRALDLRLQGFAVLTAINVLQKKSSALLHIGRRPHISYASAAMQVLPLPGLP